MLVYYKYKYEKTTNGEKKDTTVNVVTTFAGTEEVIQSTRISNDNAAIDKMVEEGNKNDITYIKSPAGIFTELTIPVDEILNGHENDTINSARISLTRINNTKHEKYNLDIPTTLLLIPNDMRTSSSKKERYRTMYRHTPPSSQQATSRHWLNKTHIPSTMWQT